MFSALGQLRLMEEAPGKRMNQGDPMRTILKEIEAIDMMGLKWKLECAVVTAWKELSRRNELEQVHVAYETSAEGRIDHLKIWSSIRRGEWDLVCDYWLLGALSHCGGMLFSKGFSSSTLELAIDKVMTHQEDSPRLLRTSYGLIQVQRPTTEGLRVAVESLANPQIAPLITMESSVTQ